jgi:AraC-like DNA-binding protein
MLAGDYLTLRSICFKRSDPWVSEGRGLCLIFPTAGTGQYFSGNVTSRLSPGDVLVFDTERRGGIFLSADGELVFKRFSVCFEHLYPLFATKEICLLQDASESFKKAKLYPASTPLAVECHRLIREVPSAFNLEHRSQLLRVVAAILSVEFNNIQARRVGYVRIEDHLMQVFEGLSTDELLTLSVAALADKFSCSRRHLNRLFHQHMGLSVAALRMELRMLKAVSLLRNPDAKVINIAQECGFNHLGLFNTCFRKRFGATPGQWRKSSIHAEGPQAGLTDAGDALPQCSNALHLGSGNRAPLSTPPVATQHVQKAEPCSCSAGHDRSNRSSQRQVKAIDVFEVMPGIKIRLHPQAADAR